MIPRRTKKAPSARKFLQIVHKTKRPRRSLRGEALVEPVDQVRHRLELARDHAEAVLAEVLRLDPERLRQLAHDLVRRDRPVPVDEMVQIPGRELGLVGEPAVGDAGLVHQALDRRPERLLAVLLPPRHQATPPSAAIGTRCSSPVLRSRTSTESSSIVFLPTVTRSGQPIRSASANFSPARWSRSSSSTSRPAASSASAACSACSSTPGRATTCTSYGAIDLGHAMPCSSWCCSTAAAITRPGPIP